MDVAQLLTPMLYFDPDHLAELDREAIARYHAIPRLNDDYRLHTELGPQPFEGDVANASIVILMNNPGFGDTSTFEDHRFHVDGWPYASLHPDAPRGMHSYSAPRFADLIAEFGAQRVSGRVALLQIHPWASVALDRSKRLVLPSMMLALNHARAALSRGALVVVGRGAWYWLPALGSADRPLFVHQFPRSVYWNRSSVPSEIYAQMRERLA
ncbi:hypothetical protein [Paraburkholderia sp. Cpub6]|uniref:hypothetical protein n=1 Tax=Paraburkholderia sp. Cpub6 TaxID=2723094 RepID=UPI001617D570|nr:hypothetical protein [Paraburkholderia sp. Cpub6]MBB5459010.1 hypothetical protein [Paraburkholderia sp. Cpub6]